MPFVEANGKRVLFVHIPRTGGTRIEAFLRQAGPLRLYSLGKPLSLSATPQHLRMTDISDLLGNDYFDYSFTIVRNPFDRMLSEFHLQSAAQANSFWHAAPSFSIWQEQAFQEVRRNPWVFDNHLRPQWEFINNGVEIFHYEDGLAPALHKAAELLGLQPPKHLDYMQPAKMDATESADFTWDFATMTRVQEMYRRDFEQFDYDFKPSNRQQ